MSNLPGKTEYALQYSDTNGILEYNGTDADARRCRNVLFGHGRAGDTGLGLDIQSYIFETSDERTLNKIRDDARIMLNQYCPRIEIVELAVDLLPASLDPTGRGQTTLVIALSIGRDTGVPYDFAFAITRKAGANVISTLVL